MHSLVNIDNNKLYIMIVPFKVEPSVESSSQEAIYRTKWSNALSS